MYPGRRLHFDARPRPAGVRDLARLVFVIIKEVTAMKRFFRLCALLISAGLILAPARTSAQKQAPNPIPKAPGEIVYEQHCASCHAAASRGGVIPDFKSLMEMSPEAVYAAMTTGTMSVAAQPLTNDEKRFVAEYLGGRPLDLARSGSAETMPNRCASNPPLGDPSAGASWNGWSADRNNTRFLNAQTAGLTPAQVPGLKLKWAFGFPGGASTYGQPSIVAGRLFVGSDNGYFYSLDAATGCVYWSFQAKAGVRTAPVVAAVQGHAGTKYAVYIGDLRGNAYALDASNGKLLWTTKLDDHIVVRVTGSPVHYQGRVYFPLASMEEAVAAAPSYPCCTFRGSVVAVDAGTGQQIWKAYTIPEEPKPTKKNSSGVQLWGPAGAAIWSAPTIDPQRGALYVGTGDAYTEPAAKTSDAVLALDLKTGKLLWSFQAVPDDPFIVGCFQGTTNENCPEHLGPDYDIGASPILLTMPQGRRMLLVTPKSGEIFALDPDRRGAVVWKLNLADKPPATNGLIALGGATDAENAYLALEDGTFAAVGLATGKTAWRTTLQPLSDLGPENSTGEPRSKAGLRFGQSAAVTGIPGVVFTGGWDGILRALSTTDGKLLWQFNTAQDFRTVNAVPAKGGSMGGPGPTVANGMLYVGSGYAWVGSAMAGNVLLAFSTD